MDKYSSWLWFRGKYTGLAVFLFAICNVHAADLEPVTITDFSCGLETTQDPTLIENGCSQDLLNVDVYTGSIEKRRGSVKQNSSVIGGFSSQAVRFVHEYPDPSGNFWLLAISSNSLYGSKDGGATNTLLTSTYGITSTSLFSAVNAYGKAYLTDGATNWITFDGNTVSNTTIPSHGSICAFFGERLWTAVGTTLYASRVGDVTDWTTDTADPGDAFSQNIRQNDGYSVTALQKFRNGMLIFKAFSIDFITLGSDGLTPNIVPVTSIKGTQHPKSVQVVNDTCIFLADDGFWRVNGPSIEKISNDIIPTVKSVRQLNSTSRSHTETTQADFSGTLTNTSRTISPNNIVLSTFQFVDTSSSDFVSGSIGTGLSTSSSVGDLVLVSSFNAAVVIDTFTDGDYTANPVWSTYTITSYHGFPLARSTPTVTNSELILLDNSVVAQKSLGYYTPITNIVGLWKAVFFERPYTGSTFGIEICSGIPTSSLPSSNCYTFGRDGLTNLAYAYGESSFHEPASFTINSGTITLSLSRDTLGNIALLGHVDGSSDKSRTDSLQTQISSFTYFGVYGVGTGSSLLSVDTITFSTFTVSTFTSQVFSFGNNLSQIGQLSSLSTLNSGSISFSVYSDSNTSIDINNSSTYASSAAVTSGQDFSLSYSSYVRYSAQFNSGPSGDTVILSSVTLDIKPTTGSYRTPDISIGTGINSWKPITFTDTLNGGSISYALYTDTDSSIDINHATTFVASQTVTSSQVPSISTAAHATIVANFTVTKTTQTPTLADYTLFWAEGGTSFPVASIVFENDYICAVAIDSTSLNDTMLIYDREGNWLRYKGMPAYSTTLYSQQPYYGSSSDGTIYRYQAENVHNDDTTAINAYWISKEFDFGYPLVNKQMERYYITATYQQLYDFVFEYGVDRGAKAATTLSLGSTTGFFHSVINPSSLTYSHGTTHSFKISDSDSNQYFKCLSITLKPRLETAP